jgi:hypothetical protein
VSQSSSLDRTQTPNIGRPITAHMSSQKENQIAAIISNMANTVSLRDRLYSKFIVRPKTRCWVWISTRNPQGYGLFQVGKSARLAHRISWAYHNGDPGDLCVLHRCDNPPCVNPEHLFLGTRTDNLKDMREKGRWKCLNPQKGSKNPFSVLTESQVKEIKRSTGSSREVAQRYGVNSSCVRKIRSGKSWTHVE